MYFLDHEPGRVSCKDGDGISDTFKRLGWRRAGEHCNEHVPAACRVSCARSARASRSANTHVPYCDTCLRLPRAQMSLHVDDTVGCQCTGSGPVLGSVCAVSARRCECQRQLQRALPVVHTCDSDYSHYTGEHVLVRDGTRVGTLWPNLNRLCVSPLFRASVRGIWS